MERFTCRTCLSVADVDESYKIYEQCSEEQTIEEFLLQYIPQMKNTLSGKERICSICLNTVKNFIEFVNRCLEIEEHLKDTNTDDEDILYKLDSQDEAELTENIQIIISNGSVDHDHDYAPQNQNTTEEIAVGEICGSLSYTDDLTYDDSMTKEEGEEDSFDDMDDIKLIPVATVSDKLLGEGFMATCNSQDDTNLSSDLTVLAEGSEIDDSAIIQIKEESSDSYIHEGSGITYRSLEDQSDVYVCEICGDGFLSEELLTDHYNVHGEVRIMCDQCPKIFKNESALKAHYKLKHSELQTFKCVYCSSVFGRVDYLRNHLKRHEEDRNKDNVKCRVPGKFLRFKNTDDPLPCKICGKFYNGIQKLKVHLQTHLVVKRFACEYCDLTYKRWPSLKRHEKTHLESPAFFHRCNVCWKRFSAKEELDVHMSQHGNPRYRCQVCNEQFHRKYLFDNHYLLKHATPEDIENSKKEVIYDTLLELSSQNLLLPE